MGRHKVAVLPGDGVGPEVIEATLSVLDAVQDTIKGLKLDIIKADAGFYCIDKYGTNLPEETVEVLKKTDATLKGPMTTPEEPNLPPSVAVTIRKMFNLYANVRPSKSLPGVNTIASDVDLVIVRENTEGLYSGKEFELVKGVTVALRIISKEATKKVARFALNLAKQRKRHLTVVHKANILRLTDGLFRDTVYEEARNFPEVNVDEMHVDAVTLQLIKRPSQFDVLVTENMFGDIISDEAAQIVGGLGIAPAANIGDGYAMFEPVHGSAPKYAGMKKVNPIATILASKMMLDYFNEEKAAMLIQKAVEQILSEKRVLTYDLGGNARTDEVGREVARKVMEIGAVI